MISREMFEEFARRLPGVPLLANMTEFGKTPFFTASEFEAMGYRMVIWPVSSLRVANKAQQHLFATLKRDGGTHTMLDQMQTRAELYATIGLHDYEALDASIIRDHRPRRHAADLKLRICWPKWNSSGRRWVAAHRDLILTGNRR